MFSLLSNLKGDYALRAPIGQGAAGGGQRGVGDRAEGGAEGRGSVERR